MSQPEDRRPVMAGAVSEAVAFYRDRPFVLIATVVLSILLATAVLSDGGLGVGEIVAVVGVGLIVGTLYAAVQNLRRR